MQQLVLFAAAVVVCVFADNDPVSVRVLLPIDWPARLPSLVSLDPTNATAAAALDVRAPAEVVQLLSFDGAETSATLRLADDASVAPFDSFLEAARTECARLGAEASCVDTVASGAEAGWTEQRRGAYDAALESRGIETTPDQYFFALGVGSFTRWFLSRRAIVTRDAATPLRLLELGSFEGGSSVWLAEHVLREPGAQLLCVDLWKRDQTDFDFKAIDDALGRFNSNMRRTPFGDRASSVASTTVGALASLLGQDLELDAFDFVYVDAGHRAPDVLADGALAFRLLRVGGVMAFDDYDVSRQPPTGCHHGIDAFLHAHSGLYEVLEVGYQYWIRKTGLVTAVL